MEKIRNDIIQKIISGVPGNMKPTEYIMRILNISKGSAYRRLNGTLSFSYEEIALLAKEMNFSVDEVIYSGSRKNHIIEFGDYFDDNVHNILYKSLEEYYEHLYINSKMHTVATIEALNNLLFVYTLFNDSLFKFFYYKYIQQYDITHLKTKMKDMVVPDSVIDIKNKITDVILNMHNCDTVSIIDPHIFLNIMSEIQYYYKRNFIDETEFYLIVKDLENLLNNLEKGAIENRFEGRCYQYYIAQRNIYSNSCLIQNETQIYSFFYQQNLHPIICYDLRLCELHSSYLQSNKRQSILISNSNEDLQISFFEKQYEYIKLLLDHKDMEQLYSTDYVSWQ